MSQAEDLLNSLTNNDISLYAADSTIEEHIVIGKDRYVIVPEPLQRIAVQYDHNIETVTFDCPRYWDNVDLSTLHIYINYYLSNDIKGRYLVDNVRVNENNSNLINFDWTITNEITKYKGAIQFLVCAIKTDSEANEEIHWNSEINNQMYISNGLECGDVVLEEYPDIINDIFTRLDTVIANNEDIIANTDEIIQANGDMLNAREEIIARIDKGLLNEVDDLQNRVTELEEENIRLKDDINSLPTIAASGEFITLEGTSEARFKKFKMEGNSYQETRSGKNLLPVDENLSITGAKGYDVSIPAGTYIVSLSSETHSGDQQPYLRFYTNNVWVVLDPSLGEKTVVLAQDETMIYLYPYGMSASESDGVTLTVNQLMISAEGGEYEQYGAAPSLDFPSEIKSVDNINVSVCNENFLNLVDTPEAIFKGITYSVSNQQIKLNGKVETNCYPWIIITKNKFNIYNGTPNQKMLLNYINGPIAIGNIKTKINIISGSTSYATALQIYDVEGNHVVSVSTNTLTDTTKIGAVCIYLGSEVVTYTDYSFNIQISKEINEYVPYKGKDVLMTLTEPLRSLPGDIRDTLEDDGIHRKVGKRIFTAVNTLGLWNTGAYFGVNKLEGELRGINTNKLLSDKLIGDWTYKEHTCYITDNGESLVVFGNNNDTLESFNNKYVGTEIYYPLAEEIIEPYTEEQQAAYNEIKNVIKSYKGLTHVYSANEINPIFDVEALKNQQLENENLQAQIDELKALINSNV